jgi:hypothetical protein
MTLYSQRGLEIYEDITNTKVRAPPQFGARGAELTRDFAGEQAYYPFAAEKEILERFGDEIACRMFGLPSSVLVPGAGEDKNGGQGEENGDGDDVHEATGAGNKPADKDKWCVLDPAHPGEDAVFTFRRARAHRGDPSVGLHNYGVNGSSNLPSALLVPSHGLAVELGSGSLDKTRHLLRSMAKLLQPGNAGGGDGVMQAIDYKAVSRP